MSSCLRCKYLQTKDEVDLLYRIGKTSLSCSNGDAVFAGYKEWERLDPKLVKDYPKTCGQFEKAIANQECVA